MKKRAYSSKLFLSYLPEVAQHLDSMASGIPWKLHPGLSQKHARNPHLLPAELSREVSWWLDWLTEQHPPGSLILFFLLRTLNELQFEDHDNAMQYHKPNTFTTISWPAEGHILIYLSPSVEFVLRFQNPDEGNYHVPMSDDSYPSPPFKSLCHHLCVPLIETIHTDDGKYTFTKIKSRWALSLSRLRSSSVLLLRMRPEYVSAYIPLPCGDCVPLVLSRLRLHFITKIAVLQIDPHCMKYCSTEFLFSS